MKCYLHKQAYR